MVSRNVWPKRQKWNLWVNLISIYLLFSFSIDLFVFLCNLPFFYRYWTKTVTMLQISFSCSTILFYVMFRNSIIIVKWWGYDLKGTQLFFVNNWNYRNISTCQGSPVVTRNSLHTILIFSSPAVFLFWID